MDKSTTFELKCKTTPGEIWTYGVLPISSSPPQTSEQDSPDVGSARPSSCVTRMRIVVSRDFLLTNRLPAQHPGRKPAAILAGNVIGVVLRMSMPSRR
ncbi:hypothetical protein ElyMa_000823300 [Elysia marginata]|uniref:Uncharacterized protein n=1 Tax=Elysia marginata TaxID=1093978 RepID=A0AAV4GZX0_9GAST|nr:hypothetical protein ElyMa_000823300 [Elysia marginata]